MSRKGNYWDRWNTDFRGKVTDGMHYTSASTRKCASTLRARALRL